MWGYMKIYEFIPGQLYGGGAIDQAGWHFIANNVNVILSVRIVPDTPPISLPHHLMLWFPIDDKIAPDLSWVINTVHWMNVLLDTGNVLYVHDTAGINRLGFVLTAFYMQRFGMSLEKALFILRQKKPNLQPRPWYMALLYQYQQFLSL